jgi:hypothetical protein
VGEGFLAIDVLALAHGVEGDRGVPVVGGADLHGVETVAEFGEHFAVILEVRHAGEGFIRAAEARSIDIAEADELDFFVLPQV